MATWTDNEIDRANEAAASQILANQRAEAWAEHAAQQAQARLAIERQNLEARMRADTDRVGCLDNTISLVLIALAIIGVLIVLI